MKKKITQLETKRNKARKEKEEGEAQGKAKLDSIQGSMADIKSVSDTIAK